MNHAVFGQRALRIGSGNSKVLLSSKVEIALVTKFTVNDVGQFLGDFGARQGHGATRQVLEADLHWQTCAVHIQFKQIGQLCALQVPEIDTFQGTQVRGQTTRDHGWLGCAFVGQLVERELLCLGVHQQVTHFTLGFELTVFIHIQVFAGGGVSSLLQSGCDQRFTHIHIGLPFVIGVCLTGVLCFGVIDRGQVTVTTLVIHRQSGAFVVRAGVVAVESFGHHLRVGWKVQAQLHQRGFFGHTGGFLGNGQHIHIAQVGFTGRVD